MNALNLELLLFVLHLRLDAGNLFCLFCLQAVNMQKGTIKYYNSLGSTCQLCLQAIAKYLKVVLKDSFEWGLECATA